VTTCSSGCARPSDVDIYTDYVLVKQRARDAQLDTALVRLEGVVSEHDAAKGQFQLRTANGRTVLVALPYNPPPAVAERFRLVRNGEQVRVSGRYIAEHRLELARFEESD
jgi:hypothetical protein